jgi:hypothetical protein
MNKGKFMWGKGRNQPLSAQNFKGDKVFLSTREIIFIGLQFSTT